MPLSIDDLDDLREARRLLETVGLAARIANTVGKPLELFSASMPEAMKGVVTRAIERALDTSLDVAVRSLGERRAPRANALHRIAVATSGAAGGAFGLAALAVELPASTTIILRSIADIARSEGESLDDPEARLACLQVLALGGTRTSDDAVETGYFAVRAVMARSLEEAARYIAQHGLTQKGSPVLVRLVSQIAARYGIAVSQKLVAQAVPVIGAVGGATVNVIFLNHFQDLARGHFIVRRLERKYGAAAVRSAYASDLRSIAHN